MTAEAPSRPSWVPTACTLPTAAQPLRRAEFDELFRSAVTRVERPAPDRVVLRVSAADPRALRATLTDLTQREASCCSFFRFALSDGDEAMRLEVAVPMTHTTVLDALAERAAQLARGTS